MRNISILIQIMGVLLVAGCRSSHADCYTPSDQTPGWKRVALPANHPSLSADESVSQFRAGEPAIVWREATGGYQELHQHEWYHASWHHHHLRTRYGMMYMVPNTATRLMSIQFSEPLNGFEVEVIGYRFRYGESVSLLNKRVGSDHIDVEWYEGGIESIEIIVHRHLHDAPFIQRARFGQRVVPDALPSTPSQFRAPRTLYYQQQPGVDVALCDRLARPLSVDATEITGTPSVVTLRKKP